MGIAQSFIRICPGARPVFPGCSEEAVDGTTRLSVQVIHVTKRGRIHEAVGEEESRSRCARAVASAGRSRYVRKRRRATRLAREGASEVKNAHTPARTRRVVRAG